MNENVYAILDATSFSVATDFNSPCSSSELRGTSRMRSIPLEPRTQGTEIHTPYFSTKTDSGFTDLWLCMMELQSWATQAPIPKYVAP